MNATAPDNPAGVFEPVDAYDAEIKTLRTMNVLLAPTKLREAVSGLSDKQLNTLYKNWTIRQITHHIADSHLHSIIRFKWALTEDHPTIKAYEEADWVHLADARHGDVEPSLLLLDGIHAKWVQVLESMTEAQFARTFHHPQSGASVSLWLALNNYAWHGEHHTAQILWLRQQNGWGNVTNSVHRRETHNE
jgi:hypothetical protein